MSDQTISKENKMGVMPINKLLISMSLPIILSMLVQALYNIVDSAFVARINENALTAVSIAFPIQNLMVAVAVGTGVGINALLSRSLGAKNKKDANSAANNGIFLAVLSYLLFAIFGIFFSRSYYEMQTDIAEVVEYGTQYMSITCIFSIGVFIQITLERLLQSTGLTIYNMITQGTGAIINIILNPILIFGLFGLPRLGVAGAAFATIIGQCIAMLLGFYFNRKKNTEIKLSIKGFKPNFKIIKTIYSVGFPCIIMQSIGSVMTYGINYILLIFSPAAVAVFGVYFKLQGFIFMPIFGLTSGMVPIIAYNYGARNKERILQTIKLSLLIATSIMIFGTLLFELFPSQLLAMFKASDGMLSMGVPALRIISLGFILAGVSIVFVSVFQALGNGFYSMILSFVRQIIVILPVAYFFAVTFGASNLWYAFPIAEIVALIMSCIMLKTMYQQKIKYLSKESEELL